MRIGWYLAAMASLLWAGIASADVTARYVTGQGQVPVMTVQVNDRGDSRVAMGNQMAVVTLNGVSYVIMADLSGPYSVRQDDMYAVMFAQFQAMMEHDGGPPLQVPPQAPRQAPFTAVRAGTETVAGRTGTVWRMRSPDEATGQEPLPHQAASLDYVLSDDADLAPIGRVWARLNEDSMRQAQQMFGSGFDMGGGLFGGVSQMFEHGTVIRIGRMLRLESVGTAPIPATVFALPGEPLTRAQYAARAGYSTPH